MREFYNLNHTRWECKYHIVWIPKYRKQKIYKELRRHLGKVLRELAQHKECEILEGHLMSDHVHILIAIPPKVSVASAVGYIKGKSAIYIARTLAAENVTSQESISGREATTSQQLAETRKLFATISSSRHKRTKDMTNCVCSTTSRAPLSGSHIQTALSGSHTSSHHLWWWSLTVDGVWVDIQYTLDAVKIDQAGHQRQQRRSEERVILAVMAVWPDGHYHILHYEVAQEESQASWSTLFENLIARGLLPAQVQLVVSDGTNGLLTAMGKYLPNAQLQRCITHKVRGMKQYLTYQQLPTLDVNGLPLDKQTAKRQHWAELMRDAYAIYDADSFALAQQCLTDFCQKWTPLELQAIHAFKWSIKRTFCFYAFDKELAVHIRTTNHLERFFREFRSRADEIGECPNETSCLTLFYIAMLRDHAKYHRLKLAKTS